MNNLILRLVALSLCALTLAACKKSTPTEPSGATFTVTSVELVSPAANVLIPNASQPVTLVVKNATVTASAGATTVAALYMFEVATDAAFTTRISTKSAVAQGSGGTSGQTAVTLDALSAGDYFWRASAEAGGTPGPVSSVNKFTIGPAISLSAPSAVGPSEGAKTSRRPTFQVRNATRTGPVGAITYKFEVSTSSTFGTIAATGTVAEGATETTYTPASNLATNTKYFWRVTALDATNNVTSAASAVQSITTLAPSTAEQIAEERGTPLWTGATPTGTPGQSGLGPGWQVRDRVSYDGQPYLSPPIEALRLFDLIDRGMDPQSAIDWLEANGYPSTGQWYPGPDVIGIPHVYIALIGGTWELVHRVGG
jgi:hypothetical protein